MTPYERVKEWRRRHPDIAKARREEAQKWRAAHPEVAKAIRDRYRLKHRDRVLESYRKAAKKRRENDPMGDQEIRRRFEAKREAMRVAQAGRPRPSVCEICSASGKTVFDHDHTTGAFRGWICDRCNKTLGHVKDDVDLLEKLRDYLVEAGRDGQTNSRCA